MDPSGRETPIGSDSDTSVPEVHENRRPSSTFGEPGNKHEGLGGDSQPSPLSEDDQNTGDDLKLDQGGGCCSTGKNSTKDHELEEKDEVRLANDSCTACTIS